MSLRYLIRFVCFVFLILVPPFASAQSQWEHPSRGTHLAKKKKQLNKERKAWHQFPNVPERTRRSNFYDPMVDYYLNNKIILCVGPALGRYKMLKKTTEKDLKLIPFKKIFITTNEPKIVGITFNKGMVIPSQCYLIPNRGKQVDCTNCIITTLRHAVNDPDVLDDDIILFKHESLYINDMELINRAIDKIVNAGFNLVIRDRLSMPEERLPTAPEEVPQTLFSSKYQQFERLLKIILTSQSFLRTGGANSTFGRMFFDTYRTFIGFSTAIIMAAQRN